MKRRLAVLVLAFTMVLTMSASVFADDLVVNTGTTVYLTKEFKIAKGIDVPSESFSFTVTPIVATDGRTDTEGYEPGLQLASNYPTLAFDAIQFANSDRANADDETLVKQSSVNLATLMANKPAGVYKWTIKENVPGADDKTEGMTYDSTSEYTLRVYMKNGDGGTEIQTITIEDEDGNKIDGGVTDSKTTEDTDGDKNFTNDGNDFKFENKYVKKIDHHVDPDNPDSPIQGAFVLSKTVLGEKGDKTYPFEFSVKVTLPSTAEAADIPTGYTDGQAKDVTLKDGENVTFGTLPAGTVIEVSETGKAHYKTTYDGAQSGSNGKATALEGSTASPTAPAANDPALANGLATKTLLVGDDGAFIDVTNYFSDASVTPTGIIINNLPYVLLIGIALGGIVLFSRKRRYE